MGARNRFYLPKENWWKDSAEDAGCELRGEEAHHCARVFRHQAGDQIEVFDGEGRCAIARIDTVAPATARLSMVEVLPAVPPPAVTLAAALLKGKSLEVIIQKACEIGVRRIVPLQTDRCIAKVQRNEAAKKVEKWRKVAIEACKQSGLNFLPAIVEPQSLGSFVGMDDSELKLVAALTSESRPLHAVIGDARIRSASVVIGPEGDFTEAEVALLCGGGYQPLDLGDYVLRAETAAVHALSLIGYELSRSVAAG